MADDSLIINEPMMIDGDEDPVATSEGNNHEKNSSFDSVRPTNAPLGTNSFSPSVPLHRGAFMDPPEGLNASQVSALLDASGAAYSQHDGQFDIWLNPLLEVENILIKWLANLARKEQTTGQKSGALELVWIKLIARLYHILVAIWRQQFANRHDNRVTVFVSHTGVDKDDYASPMSGYLTEEGVSNFLDRKSLLPGGDPEESMIEALVTCEYMWCVVTKSFVAKWHPMRELMIGYTRYQQEKGTGSFCLILDCLEKQQSRCGAWMDQILKSIQALEMYDDTGRKQWFPTMIPSNNNGEDMRERYQRIARQELSHRRSIFAKRLRTVSMDEEIDFSEYQFGALLRSLQPQGIIYVMCGELKRRLTSLAQSDNSARTSNFQTGANKWASVCRDEPDDETCQKIQMLRGNLHNFLSVLHVKFFEEKDGEVRRKIQDTILMNCSRLQICAELWLVLDRANTTINWGEPWVSSRNLDWMEENQIETTTVDRELLDLFEEINKDCHPGRVIRELIKPTLA